MWLAQDDTVSVSWDLGPRTSGGDFSSLQTRSQINQLRRKGWETVFPGLFQRSSFFVLHQHFPLTLKTQLLASEFLPRHPPSARVFLTLLIHGEPPFPACPSQECGGRAWNHSYSMASEYQEDPGRVDSVWCRAPGASVLLPDFQFPTLLQPGWNEHILDKHARNHLVTGIYSVRQRQIRMRALRSGESGAGRKLRPPLTGDGGLETPVSTGSAALTSPHLFSSLFQRLFLLFASLSFILFYYFVLYFYLFI